MDIHEIYNLIEGSIFDDYTGAGIVFVTRSGKVLMLKKPNHAWGMPGGKPTRGELPEETALRESEEETGLIGQNLNRPIKIYYKNKKYYSFICVIEKKEKVKISKEHKDYAWIPYNEIKKLKLIPPFRENLDIFLREIKNALN